MHAKRSLCALVLVACGGPPPPAAPPPSYVPSQPVQTQSFDPDVIAAIEGLKYPDPAVRRDSASLLVAKGAPAVGPMIEELKKSSVAPVKVELAWALGQIGDTRAIEPLVSALDDPDPGVRSAASEALSRIGPACVDPLLAVLEKGSTQAREEAAVALGRIGDPRAIEPLIEAMWHTDAAAVVVADFGQAASQGLMKALATGETKTKAGAAWALGASREAKAVPLLIGALSDESPVVRAKAAEALGRIGAMEASTPLISMLSDWDPAVVVSAARALGEIGAQTAVPGLVSLLDHHDSNIKATAVEAIGKTGGLIDPSPLIVLLADDHQLVQQNAAIALGELGLAPAIDPLISLLSEDDKWLPFLASDALAKIGDPAVKGLSTATRDPDPQVRILSAEALGKIGGKDATKALVDLLSDEDASSAAVDALVQVGIPAIKPLVKALSSKKAIVREGAVEALRGITGMELGDDPKAWKKLPELL